jgi:hypothetical protein
VTAVIVPLPKTLQAGSPEPIKPAPEARDADVINFEDWKWLDEQLAPEVARLLNGTLC